MTSNAVVTALEIKLAGTAARLSSLALAALLTVAMLSAVDGLADRSGAAQELAAQAVSTARA